MNNAPPVLEPELSLEDIHNEIESLCQRHGVSGIEGFALLEIGEMFHGTIFKSRMSMCKFLLDEDYVAPTQDDYDHALLKLKNNSIVLGDD